MGIMEKKMETTTILGLCRGYVGVISGLFLGGIMEKKMETTGIIGVIGIIGYILWLYRDNGKENGNYYNIGVI